MGLATRALHKWVKDQLKKGELAGLTDVKKKMGLTDETMETFLKVLKHLTVLRGRRP